MKAQKTIPPEKLSQNSWNKEEKQEKNREGKRNGGR